MRQLFKPSTILAMLALVIAASGTAVAATKLVNGDKLIKKGTLSGNRLRKHTLTGTQINVSKLGKVPSAKKADTATSATTATTATNATNATNAAELGGQPASSYLSASSRIGTNGIVTTAGSASGTTVTLFKSGPFTVSMKCAHSGTSTALTLLGSSSEGNSDLNGILVPVANTVTDLKVDITPAKTGFFTFNDVNLDFEAPSGAQALVIGAEGVNGLGVDCWGNWAGIQ
jgi:hypothetical protein